MKEEKIREFLYEGLASLENVEAVKNLLMDLCTYKEIDNMAQRLYAAKLLSEGKTYQEVIEASGLSSATLSRVSRAFQYGKGYQEFFEKKSHIK